MFREQNGFSFNTRMSSRDDAIAQITQRFCLVLISNPSKSLWVHLAIKEKTT